MADVAVGLGSEQGKEYKSRNDDMLTLVEAVTGRPALLSPLHEAGSLPTIH